MNAVVGLVNNAAHPYDGVHLDYEWPGDEHINIASATNASPIQVTTQFPHGFPSGTKVYVAGVQGNEAANNTEANPDWTISNVTATTFTLTGSAGSGPPVANTGYVTQGPQERDGYVDLITRFRTALPVAKTVSLSSSIDYLNGRFFPAEESHGQLDWWTIQSYGFHGPAWTDHTGHASQIHNPSGDLNLHWPHGLPAVQTPSYDTSLPYWLGRNIPRAKIRMGIGLYGNWYRSKGKLFAGWDSSTDDGEDAPFSVLKTEFDKVGWVQKLDGAAVATYHENTGAGDLITAPSQETVQASMRYAVVEDLKGVSIWAAGQDWVVASNKSVLVDAMKTTAGRLERLWIPAAAFTAAQGSPMRAAYGDDAAIRKVAAWSMPYGSTSAVTTNVILPSDWLSTVPIVLILHWARLGATNGGVDFGAV